MQQVGLQSGVGHRDCHQDVGRIRLGVRDVDNPIAVVVEDPGIEQLVFRIELAAPAVLVEQQLVRERALRIVITPHVPGVTGQRVEVPPILLDVLAVIGFCARQAERTLFEDRVPSVPQRQRHTQPLLDVAKSGEPVLPPPVRPGARLVMRQIVPGFTISAVVLPDSAPLPLAEIRAPQIPITCLAQAQVETAEAVYPLALRT